MPAKGQSQTEETKKKISEALQKGGPEEEKSSKPTVRSQEGQRLFDSYEASKKKTNELRAAREALMAKSRSLPRGKKSTATRAAIKQKLAEVAAELKKQELERRAIRTEALALQRVRKAEVKQKEIAARRAQLKVLESRAKDLLSKAKSDKAKERVQAALTRIAMNDSMLESRAKQMADIIAAKGTVAQKDNDIFATELLDTVCLAERGKKFEPWRKLTFFEERAGVKTINEQFDEIEQGLEDALIAQTQADLERSLETLRKRIEAGDIAGIAAITLLSIAAVKKILQEHQTKAQEVGKKAASREISVERPNTPRIETQLSNLEAEQVAQAIAEDLEQKAKEISRQGLLKKVAVGAIAAAVANAVRERASTMIANVVGTLVGEHFNIGRRIVFDKNTIKVKAYQRSEVLDSSTCNLCLSLDKRILPADDPFTKLDLVHSNCRGFWVPILQQETVDGKVGVPKTVKEAFDTVGGAPVVNSFTQLKKPINKANQDAQREISRRIAAK